MQVRPWSFECLVEWLKIREQEGRTFPKDVEAFIQELDHSALLQRLVSGKPPLPIAPPLSFGYPWYELLENGHAEPLEVYLGDKTANEIYGHRVVIINQAVWKVIEQISDSEFMVSHDDAKGLYSLHRIDKASGKAWLLERVTQAH